jgi:hypothetical protein
MNRSPTSAPFLVLDRSPRPAHRSRNPSAAKPGGRAGRDAGGARATFDHAASTTSLNRFISRYRRVPHFEPATCCSRAVNRLKTLKRQMYGRAGFALLRARVLLYIPLPTFQRTGGGGPSAGKKWQRKSLGESAEISCGRTRFGVCDQFGLRP